MTAVIFRALLAGLWKPFALIAAALGLRHVIRKNARQETALQAAERHDKAAQKGREEDARARAALRDGDTAEDILRRNDGEWR
jgi:hypothetical protein